MALSSELVAEFAKLIRNDDPQTETTVYGTIVESDGSKYLVIDGSTILTPISTTVDALSGERVTAIIKDHSVVVTGNLTSPAARTGTVKQIDERTTPSKLADLLYPVGSIYMSVSETGPETLFGGVWEQIRDTFLLASGSTYAAGATGGEASKTIDISNLPGSVVVKTSAGTSAGTSGQTAVAAETSGFSSLTDITGGASGITFGVPIDNMPPYLAVYVWKRIE